MNYEQTIQYLFERLPMYQRVGAKAFKKDLTNIRKLCNALGNPQQQFGSIHIAGTNGKGSTAHMLAAVLQQSGRKTGLYTSPHMVDFRERVKVGGKLIPKKSVVEFVRRSRPLFDEIQPSFFEISVALAFWHFARCGVDIAVVETGLGGRLDSTNIIVPLLSVITNIGFDHTNFLGDTLPKIAAEKAGIIKAGVPVVIGETQPETEAVFVEKASECNSPIYFADQNLSVQNARFSLSGFVADVYRNNELLLPELKVDLAGQYQTRNLATVLQSVTALNEHNNFALQRNFIYTALSKTKKLTRLIGRWQVICEQPLTIADSAHNPDGLKLAIRQLVGTPHNKLHIVLGMVSDKDHDESLPLFPTGATYYFCCPDVPRGLPESEIRQKASKFGLEGEAYPSVKIALSNAQNAAKIGDVVFVGGSTFVVAEVV